VIGIKISFHRIQISPVLSPQNTKILLGFELKRTCKFRRKWKTCQNMLTEDGNLERRNLEGECERKESDSPENVLGW
jgi:hypothetical protein